MNITRLSQPIIALGFVSLVSACSTDNSESNTAQPPGPNNNVQDTGSADTTDDDDSVEDTSPADTGDANSDDTTATLEGAYSGDLVITMDTQWGEDTCTGTAALAIDGGSTLSGDGNCSFSILGSQVPDFAGEVTEDGVATGAVDLEVFGTAFSLEWTGTWNESEIVVDYDGATTLSSIGDVTYSIDFTLVVEEQEETDGGVSYDGDDYSETGTIAYSRSEGSFTTTDGCESDYTLFSPTGASADAMVVIQHGFARSLDNFTGWAEHLASWNIPSLVVNLCHSSAWDINIDQNGEDAYEVARSLTDAPLLFIGHSNGALSSLVAASLDDDPIAVLGLDPVERIGGDHTGNAEALDVPVYSMFGESGLCNSWNSGLTAYQAAANTQVLRITEADHCDFESPTDSTCTFACSGSNNSFDDDAIQSTIIGMGTAFVLWQILDDEAAKEWWRTDGAIRADLESDGAISDL